jgi:hypothetical protein
MAALAGNFEWVVYRAKQTFVPAPWRKFGTQVPELHRAISVDARALGNKWVTNREN